MGVGKRRGRVREKKEGIWGGTTLKAISVIWKPTTAEASENKYAYERNVPMRNIISITKR